MIIIFYIRFIANHWILQNYVTLQPVFETIDE